MKMTLARVATLAMAAFSIGLVAVAPVRADSPERLEGPFYVVRADLENGVGVFWNITRADYCDWQASGFAGPPPVIELVPVTMHETRPAAVVTSYKATRPTELWALDGDVPPLGDPCSDTDELSAPWARGAVHVTYTDNDFFASMTRTNVFGDRGEGTVLDADGAAWHYSWTFRVLFSQDGEVSIPVANSNLKRKGS